MFLSGARDTYVPCHMSQLLCQMTGHAPDTAHWNVPGAKHNQERMAAPREFDERIVQFFDRMTVPAEQPARRAALLA
jgi:hypothetical protein